MAEEQKQKFELRKLYVKDISFESPQAPTIFKTGSFTPSIDVQLNVSHRRIGDNIYESILTVTVNGILEDKDAFLVEVHQAGLFEIAGIDGERGLNAVLEIACPTMLFPFAREAVCDQVVRGGFPQLLLAPVNFDALYRQKLQGETDAQSDGKPGKSKQAEAEKGADGAAS